MKPTLGVWWECSGCGNLFEEHAKDDAISCCGCLTCGTLAKPLYKDRCNTCEIKYLTKHMGVKVEDAKYALRRAEQVLAAHLKGLEDA